MPKLITLTIGHDVNETEAAKTGTDVRSHSQKAVHSVLHRHLSAEGITAYTLTRGIGYWQGEQEDTTIVTILLPDERDSATSEDIMISPDTGIERVRRAAEGVRDALSQECIMSVTRDVTGEYI